MHSRVEPGRDAPFDTPHICLCGCEVMIVREQECHVDRDASKDRFLDGRKSFPGSWNFDKKVGSCRPGMELFGCSAGACGIIGQQWRYLQRHPAINAVRRVVHLSEEISSLGNILQCKFVEECFT